jgi:hypothetical protein
MKLSHAAALALVGWYLMVPPTIKKDGGYEADFNAPLSRWSVNTPFDSTTECAALNSEVVLEYKKRLDKARIHSFEWAVAQSLVDSQCISTDDPRLKEK